jgi:hypothetical protein
LRSRDYKILPTLIAWPIALLAMLHGSSAVAQRQYDPKQLAMLPPYCKYTQLYRQNVPGGSDPQQIERWSSVMGAENFIHMHHYCLAGEREPGALFLEHEARPGPRIG